MREENAELNDSTRSRPQGAERLSPVLGARGGIGSSLHGYLPSHIEPGLQVVLHAAKNLEPSVVRPMVRSAARGVWMVLALENLVAQSTSWVWAIAGKSLPPIRKANRVPRTQSATIEIARERLLEQIRSSAIFSCISASFSPCAGSPASTRRPR